jgi:predicted dehydrogenase
VNLAVKIPDEVNFESAGFTTIGAIAMQGIRRANVTFGETIIITGLGLLGLIAVQIAKAWGLVVIGVDINTKRLELAKKYGADFCFNATDPSFLNSVKSATSGNGADAVVVYAATKSSDPANQALNACRKKGRVVVVGAIGMDIQREAMYVKELDFVMSTSYGPGRYDSLYEMKGVDYPIGYVRWTENRNMIEFVRLLSKKLVNVEDLISHSFSINEAAEAYKILVENSKDNIACIFKYDHGDYENLESHLEMYPRAVSAEKIRVGIIGAGSFIQDNHLANILLAPNDFELIAIANRTPESAKSVGEKYKLRYVTTDYKNLLSDPDIDLIVIGTRHNLHAIQVADAIKAGKHVLVEKPLAMSFEELNMIEEAAKLNPNVLVSVGFNRRYSPLIIKAKKIIESNHTPIVINYRVNAGFFPPDMWVQKLDEGGGRIIGEGCHFIDLMAHLANSGVAEIHPIHIPVDRQSISSEDNFIVSVSFKNGSIGVLTYVSVGAKEMPKERIEIFSNGTSMIIHDFMEIEILNNKEQGIKLKQSDKGHKQLILEIAKRLKNKESLILPFNTDIEMTKHTLSVVDQIHCLKIQSSEN